MSYRELAKTDDAALLRDDPFAYRCQGCGICCHNKAIRVSAFEILYLARHLGLTTTDFITQHTEAGGTVLRRHDDRPGAPCVFLAGNACGVHNARPLVCRIYPLGRHLQGDGSESFVRLAPEPDSAGLYEGPGTVGGYLERQGLPPFLELSERYMALYGRMVERLAELDPDEIDHRADRRAEVDELAPGLALTSMIDIDATVADHCRARGMQAPSDTAGLIALHFEALEDWIDGSRGNPSTPDG